MKRARRIGLVAVAGASAAAAAFGTPAADGQVNASDRLVFGALSGDQERGPNGQRGVGDSDGRGSASGIVRAGELCYALTVQDLDAPVAAHIHRGRRGKNGPVVIPLKAPEGGDGGTISGCVRIRSSLSRELRRRPANFYWNIHTRAKPDGAVRGQVFTRGS